MQRDRNLEDFMSKLDSGVYFLDLDRNVTFWNRAAELLTGYSRERALGTRCSDNLLRHITADGAQLCLHGCPLCATMADGEVREAEVYMHHSDGNRVPIVVWAAPLTDESGATIGAIEMFSDRRERSALLARLEALSHEVLTDPLTGLGNRRYLQIVAESRFKAVEDGGTGFGLFMADIDNFKRVNDTYGHAVGDRVLKMVASTLSSAVRPLDAAVRWGGEEFILLCPNVPAEKMGEIGERLRLMVENSWIHLDEQKTLAVTASIGTARAVKSDTLESIVSRADKRLYEAKNSGRNRCVSGD
jgi:diguanylate cyclase (GGDEF)-like protein/PAS domain S-box-containing protein